MAKTKKAVKLRPPKDSIKVQCAGGVLALVLNEDGSATFTQLEPDKQAIKA